MKFRRDVKRANKGSFSDQAQFSILAIVVLLSSGRWSDWTAFGRRDWNNETL